MENSVTFLNSSVIVTLAFQNERIVFANPAAAKLTGYTINELTSYSNDDFIKLFHPQDRSKLSARLTADPDDGLAPNFRLIHRNKTLQHVTIRKWEGIVNEERATILEFVDVTKLVQFEARQGLTAKIIATLNLPNMPIRTRLTELLSDIRRALEIDSVGIRLRSDELFSLSGIRDPFTLFLGPYRMNCEPSNEGKDCLCGAILRSESPNLPCFTPRGSFITNHYSTDMDQIEGLAPLLTRYRCSRDGFTSIASIPICSEGRNLGILHLASPNPGCFPQDSVSFLEALGEFIGFALLRQKALDELHRLKEVAKSYHPMKFEFLAAMSHEIRSPMNAILGFSELLAESPLEGKYREYLNIVKSRGQDLLQIIDNVLGLARLEANQIPILAESFSLRDCITSVVADVRPGVQIKGLAFVSTLDDGLPELVCGDSVRVHQVLTKLLSSSVKLTATGEIRLAVKLDRSPKENRTRIVFSISDTGIGFALEDLDTIFDPQTKEDAYRTRTFGGVNLDLIIVRHLIKAMNGEIYVDSKMGRGTNFNFHLDFILPDTPIKQKVFDSLIASPPSMTILLADDDITSRILFGAMLRRDGHTVVEAMDGGMALASASQMDFDLILMDIQMPGMDGISATRAIRSMKNQHEPVLEKRSAVPIVALTAHALPEDEEACLNAGMNGYLKKPLQADTLRACLNSYAKKKPQ